MLMLKETELSSHRETGTFPNFGVFSFSKVLVFVQLFGLYDYVLLQKRMSAFQISFGEIHTYGKIFSSNKIA